MKIMNLSALLWNGNEIGWFTLKRIQHIRYCFDACDKFDDKNTAELAAGEPVGILQWLEFWFLLRRTTKMILPCISIEWIENIWGV